MVFSSVTFLFVFLPITLVIYFLFKGALRNYWLLAMSLLFFSWSQPQFLWVICLSVLINYFGGVLISLFKKISKLILFGVVTANLLILFYFKYLGFVVDTINSFTNFSFSCNDIVLPIGISFFTFQGVSYVIDVYRSTVPVQKNPVKVALYIMLFPQLIAGPIVRYTDVLKDIDDRNISADKFVYGIERFIIGLAKKVIIANSLAEIVDSIWNQGTLGSMCSVAWLGSIAYTLQIYFDFSGYSDMAIGLGRMLGFHFPENFDLPYISRSISEFWRRWHISLSSWFRDYVYIPLGGNKKYKARNLAIVFLLTGIWHGAAWNFVLWGIWNGVFVIIEYYSKKKANYRNKKPVPMRLKEVLGLIYTLFVVNVGWVLFRAQSIKAAIDYISIMFGIKSAEFPGYTIDWYLSKWNLLILVLGLFFASSVPKKLFCLMTSRIDSEQMWCSCVKYIGLVLLMYFCMIRITSGTYNPFIYFQF